MTDQTKDEQTAAALAAMLSSVTPEQRKRAIDLSRAKGAPRQVDGLKKLCNEWDKVTVRFPGGQERVLTAWKIRPCSMRLSTQDRSAIQARNDSRMNSLARARAALAKNINGKS